METIKEVISKNFTRLVEGSTLSQKVIAKKVGVSETTIYRWKSGENTPEPANIDKLSEVLGVSPLEFYKAETEKTTREPVSIAIKKVLSVPDDIYEMAQRFDLSDDVWEAVRGAMEDAIEEREEMAKSKKQG